MLICFLAKFAETGSFFFFFCHLSLIVCLLLGFMLRTKMHIVLKMV